MGTTPQEMAGKLYVYVDEERDAVAVSRWRVGPNGGLTADGIARMQVPGKHVSREELNTFASLFAAAPDLLEALRDCLIMIGRLKKHCQITDGAGYTPDGRMLKLTDVEQFANAAIAKARGQ